MNTHTTSLKTRSSLRSRSVKVLPPELNEIHSENLETPDLQNIDGWLSYNLQPQWLGAMLRVYRKDQLMWAIRLGSTSGTLMLPELTGPMTVVLDKDHLQYSTEV